MPATAHLPVVMLTGSQEEADVARSDESGVNALVVKPMDFKELVRAVGEVGTFWAVINEPPPGSVRYERRKAA